MVTYSVARRGTLHPCLQGAVPQLDEANADTWPEPPLGRIANNRCAPAAPAARSPQPGAGAAPASSRQAHRPGTPQAMYGAAARSLYFGLTARPGLPPLPPGCTRPPKPFDATMNMAPPLAAPGSRRSAPLIRI
jgi:hypothetical protein